jgi:hypothetical protein
MADFYLWMRRVRYVSESEAAERVGFLRLLVEGGADLRDGQSVRVVVRGLDSAIASRAAQAYRLFLSFLECGGVRGSEGDFGLRDWVLAVWEKKKEAKKHYASQIVRLREGDWLLYPPVPPERAGLVERLGESRVPRCRRVMATVAEGCTLLIPLQDGIEVVNAPRPPAGWRWSKRGWWKIRRKASG